MGSRKKRAASWQWRSATKVVDGAVRPKNAWRRAAPARNAVVVRRERDGRGWRHVLRRKDVFRFLELMDDWDELSRGLSEVVLAEGSYGFGYYRPGVVGVRALPGGLDLAECYLDEHALRLLEVLDVRREAALCEGCRKTVPHRMLTIAQARAWQLLDVLQHELGHHHDARVHRGGRADRREAYALAFAEERWRRLWPAYQRAFRI